MTLLNLLDLPRVPPEASPAAHEKASRQVSFNGDFFDYPFVQNRAKVNDGSNSSWLIHGSS